MILYTLDSQWPLSGVHPNMMENQPSLVIYHHVQSCGVRSSEEGRYTPPISAIPLYELCDYNNTSGKLVFDGGATLMLTLATNFLQVPV